MNEKMTLIEAFKLGLPFTIANSEGVYYSVDHRNGPFVSSLLNNGKQICDVNSSFLLRNDYTLFCSPEQYLIYQAYERKAYLGTFLKFESGIAQGIYTSDIPKRTYNQLLVIYKDHMGEEAISMAGDINIFPSRDVMEDRSKFFNRGEGFLP